MATGAGHTADDFLELIRRSKQGKFKLYIGMSAGVGKTYRMLQEAHALLRSGVNIKIGYIETHRREETQALLTGLPEVPRRKVFYRGKELEEMDLQEIINQHPEVVLVDELAHTNIPGSKHEKRWQDVLEILEAGISVISAVNIQHIESLNDVVKKVTGIEVAERVPDSVLKAADEVVNIDLTADELIERLKTGKIYAADKVEIAMRNFFRPERILQLRELALKEVAGQIERKVETEIPANISYRHEKILACVSSNEKTARVVIRKAARLAGYYSAQWFVLYVETPRESADKIPLDKQRHLINNLKLATELGATVLRHTGDHVVNAVMHEVDARAITTVCIGKPHLSLLQVILSTGVFNGLLKKLSQNNVDLIILS